MPRRKEIIADKIRPYHIASKALEGKPVFEAPEDMARFIFQIYAANMGKPMLNMYRKNIFLASEAILRGEELPAGYLAVEHDPLVGIFSFVVLKDRYCLGLVPTEKDSIARFMHKLNLGFAKYYNLKYKRTGPLFEGRFHASPVSNPQELSRLVRYINIKKVLDAYNPDWINQGLHKTIPAYRFVAEYAYSSFPDLFGERGCLILVRESRDTLKSLLGDGFFTPREEYEELVREFSEEDSEKDSLYV